MATKGSELFEWMLFNTRVLTHGRAGVVFRPHPREKRQHIFEVLNLYTPEVQAAWSGLFSTSEARHYHAPVAALKAPGADRLSRESAASESTSLQPVLALRVFPRCGA